MESVGRRVLGEQISLLAFKIIKIMQIKIIVIFNSYSMKNCIFLDSEYLEFEKVDIVIYNSLIKLVIIYIYNLSIQRKR